MTTWGPWEHSGGNGMRVGIDVSWTAGNGGSIKHSTVNAKATVRIYTEVQFNYQDNQTLSYSGSISGSTSFFNGQSSGTVQRRATKTYRYSYGSNEYDSSPGNRTFRANLSGAYNGVTPSVSVSSSIPSRPSKEPAKVGRPSISHRSSSNGQANVNWNAPDDNGESIDAYDVLCERPGGANVDRETSGTDGVQTMEGLQPGQDYTARVRARNANGWGSWSNKRSFSMPPLAPDKPSRPDVSDITGSSVRVGYGSLPDNNGDSIDRFRILVERPNGSNVADIIDTTNLSTPYRVDGLDPGTDYTVRVRAHNSAGWSPWSNERSFTTDIVSPSAPGTPSVSNLTSNGCDLSWTAPSDTGGAAIEGYRIQIATDSGFNNLIYNVFESDPSTSRTVTGLPPATDLWARVRAYNGSQNSSYSGARAFQTLSGVRIGDGTNWIDCIVRKGTGGGWQVVAVRPGLGADWSE